MSVAGGSSRIVQAMELGRGLAVYPGIEAAQWLSPERLRILQWQRLRRAIEHAAAKSPLYRQRFAQLGIQPADIRTLENYRRLPLTTRDDLRQPDQLLSDGVARERLRISMTSGSTGRRTISYFDERAWVLAKYLLKLRARRACGLQPWHRVALFQEGASDCSMFRPGIVRMHSRSICPLPPSCPRFSASRPTHSTDFPAISCASRRQPQEVFGPA